MASKIYVLHITYYCIANSIYGVWIVLETTVHFNSLIQTRVTRTGTQLQTETTKNLDCKIYIQIMSGNKIHYNNYYYYY